MFLVDKYKGLTILQTWTKVAHIPHYLYPIYDTTPGNSIQLQEDIGVQSLHLETTNAQPCQVHQLHVCNILQILLGHMQ